LADVGNPFFTSIGGKPDPFARDRFIESDRYGGVTERLL